MNALTSERRQKRVSASNLAEQLCKLLVVEDLEAAAGRDLADGRRMKAVVIVAVAALHEDAAVAEALCKHLASDVVQVNPCHHVQQVKCKHRVPTLLLTKKNPGLSRTP